MSAVTKIGVDDPDKAQEIYDRRVRPSFERDNVGRLVAIDLGSEDFEIGDNVLAISARLRERRPAAEIETLRIGGGPVRRIGYFAGSTGA